MSLARLISSVGNTAPSAHHTNVPIYQFWEAILNTKFNHLQKAYVYQIEREKKKEGEKKRKNSQKQI